MALVTLYLEASPGDVDPVFRNAILDNGDPVKIADMCAAMFAATLLRLERQKVISSASPWVEDIREMYIRRRPGSGGQA